jgi:dTDP-4-dehydrorhamnose reductase
VLARPAQLVPTRVADVKLRAPRPQYCALSNAKLASVGVTMPTWQDAVARYVRKRQGKGQLPLSSGQP